MDETYCYYVGSYALIKTATHKSPNPISDFGGLDPDWYRNLYPHSVLQVCPQALPEFVKKVLPAMKVPFKLLTNNSDCTIPSDFQAEADIILSHPMLETWFAQNCTGTHPKLTKIPIGLDYHSMRPSGLKKRFSWDQTPVERHAWGIKKHATEQEWELTNFKNTSKPFWDRQLKAYANFQFLMWTRYGKIDRKDALENVPRDLVFYEPIKVTRDISWRNMSQYAFVLSPHGNGLDCHRTWESLCLGCIPIIKSSGIDGLFTGLPVWIVDEWTDVTRESMQAKIDEFRYVNFNYEKLTLAYWRNILSQNTNAIQNS